MIETYIKLFPEKKFIEVNKPDENGNFLFVKNGADFFNNTKMFGFSENIVNFNNKTFATYLLKYFDERASELPESKRNAFNSIYCAFIEQVLEEKNLNALKNNDVQNFFFCSVLNVIFVGADKKKIFDSLKAAYDANSGTASILYLYSLENNLAFKDDSTIKILKTIEEKNFAVYVDFTKCYIDFIKQNKKAY